MLQNSLYHSILRVSLVVVATVLVFESGLVSNATKQLANTTESYLASAIGMSASVEPTELNQITAELTAQRNLLNQREEALRQREIDIGLAEQGGPDYTTYVLAALLFILLVLILLNYVLDYLRYRDSRLLTQSEIAV